MAAKGGRIGRPFRASTIKTAWILHRRYTGHQLFLRRSVYAFKPQLASSRKHKPQPERWTCWDFEGMYAA